MKFLKDKLFRYPFLSWIWPHRWAYALGLFSLIAVDIINVALPVTIKEAVDAISLSQLPKVYRMAILYFGLMAVQAIGRYLWRIYLIGTSHEIARGLRLKLYDHLQNLPLNYYYQVRTGDLMSRATNDIESVRMALGPGILVGLDSILMFTLILPVMFYFSWKLSLLAFAFYPAVPWITARIGSRIDELYEDLQKKMSGFSAHMQESFVAIRLIRSLVMESEVTKRARELSENYRLTGNQRAKYEALFSPSLTLITDLGSLLILVVGGWDVLHGTLTLGTFIAFQRFVVQLSWPMEAIGWAITLNKEGAAAKRRLDEVFSVPAIKNVHEIQISQAPPITEALLCIQSLNFQYPHSLVEGDPSFRLSIDKLVVPRGAKIGIVGPVGSGKSTLLSLIKRLYEPSAGTLFLNGKDILTIPLKELRKRIASVEQQVFLFSESILKNIQMGIEALDPSDIQPYVRVAGIDSEIDKLSSGLHSQLGERGVNLSGGQKQRIALARALVRRPQCILLDDSFSAIDVEIEQKILDAFFKKFETLTVLCASHRLSIMPRMTEVWVLDRGTVVARGTHADLMSRSRLYRELWLIKEEEPTSLPERTLDGF